MAAAVGTSRWIGTAQAKAWGIDLPGRVLLIGPKDSLEKLDAKAQEVLQAWAELWAALSDSDEEMEAAISKLKETSKKHGIAVNAEEITALGSMPNPLFKQ